MELEYQDWTRLQGRGPHTGGRTAATTTSWGGGCGRVWGRTMILRWTPSWAHRDAGSASPKQWRLTVAMIDQVGALPVHSPGPRPSAALRPCLCAVCLPSRQCGGSGICCRALVQIGGFSAKALSTGSFWAHKIWHAGTASPAQWRLKVARIDKVPCRCIRPRPSAALRPCLCAVCLPSRQCGGSGICCHALVQIGGVSAMALGTGCFWSHIGKASDYQWRITEGRVAWVVKLNPAATTSDNSFWGVMCQN